MTDKRCTADPKLVYRNEEALVITPIAELCRKPGGPRDRQLLMGAAVTVLHHADEWRLLRAEKDGYCGYVKSSDLGPRTDITHHVTAPSTHLYTEPDLKSPDLQALSFGSQITATSETASFIETEAGFIPRQHLHHLTDAATADPIAIAALFLGTPYLWGGNSRWGIDCSGLVQAALLSCGIPCPGDSDQQFNDLGTALPDGAAYQRGDLLFWKGHVALVVDDCRIIHANAGYMSVVYEDIETAKSRIDRQGDGPVTAHKRL